MQTVLEMMAAALTDTWEAVVPFVSAVPLWAWATIATVILLLAALAVLRSGRDDVDDSLQRPEMMLSRAEMAPDPETEARYELLAAFSNLHHGPVQLLRIAAVGGDGKMAVVETTALVMARRAVELEAELDIVGGGKGQLELYLYVPSSPARAWRLRVPMAWEPWSRRFKADTLNQRLDPVNHLPEPPVPPRGVPAQPAAGTYRERGLRDFPDEF